MRDGVPVLESVCAFCKRWANAKNGAAIVIGVGTVYYCCHRCALARGLLIHTSWRN
jgi:hypothetical protein